ncbi:MAG: SGNH/GDSL hydrolase family protein [Cyanobacteria bacterium P01_G01_bin.54]
MKILEKSEILVLGDSHTGVFSHPSAMLDGYRFRVMTVSGATISGLKNPNSATQARPIFEKAIHSYKGKILITLLGEVDTGFVIWYRAKKHNYNVQEILDQTVSRYIEFIQKIPLDKHVIVIGAPLPTIQDGQDWGEIANARKDVTASQLERTELTIQLNQRMKSYAKESGVLFIDLDAESLGDDGLVNQELLSSNRTDHHYDKVSYINILKPKLARCVEQISAGNVAPRRA